MTWSVVEGDFDETPAPQQYYREPTWTWVPEDPPTEAHWQLEDVTEKWTAKRTFTQAGRFHFEVRCTYTRNGPPPPNPANYYYNVYVVEPQVYEVSYYRIGQGPNMVQMKQRGDSWQDDAFDDDCTLGDGAHTIAAPQWTLAGNERKPVCYVTGDVPELKAKVTFMNENEDYGPPLAFEFAEQENSTDFGFSGQATATTNGDFMVADVWVTTTQSFPSQVSNHQMPIAWRARAVGGGGWHNVEQDSTSNPIWVSWGYPMFGAWPGSPAVTAQRVNWVTDKANGCASIMLIADAIWTALGGDPPYEWGYHEGASIWTDGWELMIEDQPNANPPFVSPYFGLCDHQAQFMVSALAMLGVGSEERNVRASDANGPTPYECTDIELREDCSRDYGRTEALLLCFGSVDPVHMNAFEGCCVVESQYWYSAAFLPQCKAYSDLDMLETLAGQGVTQWWCWFDYPNSAWRICIADDAEADVP